MLIDQAGLPPGVPGFARRDGKSDGSLVTLTDTRSGGTTVFELLWVPLNDTEAIPSLEPLPDNNHTWRFSPQSGVTGPYRIKLTHTENGAKTEEIRIFGVADENGRVPPAPGERTDPRVTRLTALDPALIARCERNWPIPGFPAGNPFGWSIDAFIPTTGGVGGGGGTQWRYGDSAPNNNVGTNGDYYLRSNGQIYHRANGIYSVVSDLQTSPETASQISAALSGQQSEIDALETQNASQQSEIDALEGLHAQQQTAIDSLQTGHAAQQSAITTLQTGHTTQQSAITALQSGHTAQQAEIDTAQSDIVSLFSTTSTMAPLILRQRTRAGVQVEDYGSIVGSNFADTIRAAIVGAYNESGAPDHSANNPGAVNVLLPRGQFRCGNTPLFFPGNYPKYTPGLIGVPGGTGLAWEPDLNGPMISCGSEIEGASFANATLYQAFENIELRSVSGIMRKGGFKSRFGIHQRLTDVLVRGLNEPGQHWRDGIAFDFQISNVSDADRNHQHPRLFGCRANFCQTGFIFTGSVWSASLYECHANANLLAGAVYDSSVVSWIGGNTQGNGGLGYSTDHWCSGTRTADHNTGWDYIEGLPSGVGATLSVRGGPGNQFCTLGGLANMKGYYGSTGAATHRNLWVEIIDDNPVGPFDLVTGLYKIEAVNSAGEVVIRKGSLHVARTGLRYQVRGGRGGNRITISHAIYHEGHVYALGSLGADLHSESAYEFHSVESNNVDYVVDAVDVAAVKVTQTKNLVGGTKVARIQKTKSFETDVPLNMIQTDSWSRNGLVGRTEGFAGYRGYVMDSKPRAVSYNTILRERGAIAIYDAKAPASIIRSGANVSQWRNLAHASIGHLGLVTPGSYPQYVANDPGLGGPAIRIVGGASAAAVSSMVTDITGLMPSQRHGMTVLAVARTPNADVSAARRIKAWYSNWAGDGYEIFLAYNDAGWNPNPGVYAHAHSPQVGFTTPILAPADALPHWSYATTCLSGAESGGGGSELGYHASLSQHGAYEEGIAPGVTVNLDVCVYDLGIMADLYISHIAVFARGITVGERDSLMDAARFRWPLPEEA